MNYHLPFLIVICSHHMQDINATQPDDTTGYGTFFQHEIAVLITVAVLLVSVVITIYFWKQRYKRKRKKENMDMSQLTEAHVLLHQSAYKPVNIDRSQLSMTEYEDEADMCTSQTIQTDLQSLSSPKTSILKIQRKRTYIGSFEVQPLPKDEDNLLHAAYTILYTVPRAIEDYIEREYAGGFLQAIRDYKDQLKAKLRSKEWDLLSQLIVHHRLYHFYDQIIQDTILDNEVLDLLISRSILRKEDREEIEHHPRQSDRNKCILDLLIQRPNDSYSVLLDVLKESPTCSEDLIECMEDQTFSNHGVVSQSKVKSCITGKHSVKLTKNYSHLIQNLSNTEDVIDSLISMGVLDPDDRAEINSSGVQTKINRKLIYHIRSEEEYQFFLEALKEDPTNARLASDLESTDVKQDDVDLLHTGATLSSLTNRPGFQTLVTLVSIFKAVQMSDAEPESHDYSLSADLYRLQSWFKKVIKMTKMDSDKYQQFVHTVKEILVRIGRKNDPVVIETTLNTVMKKQVQKILYGLREKEENSDFKERIMKMEADQEEIIPRIVNMETEQEEVIPKNIRDQIQKQIEDWEKKDKMFVTTRASDYVMECLQENSCVTLTAPSGVGKSFISRHTALVLHREGYGIVPVELPTEIKTYYQPGKQTVFIVDDICGNFTANQQQIDHLKQLLPVINTIIADKCCKIIVSCRLQVYKDNKFDILSPFKSCECNLISDQLCLTSIEKINLAKTYIGTSVDDIDELSQNSEFFPLLCSVYNEVENGDVKEFFENPFIVYQNELDKLSRHGDEGNYKICSLAFCVLFNNHLTEKWLEGKMTDEQRQIIEDTCDACEINRSTSKVKLKKTLDTLDGTFICKQNNIYRTVHDKLFDFLAYYFGQKMIECLIDHGQIGNIDFIIEIPNTYLNLYLERIIRDWSVGKVTVVFSNNNNMKVSSFRQQLVQYLQQLDQSHRIRLANTKDTVISEENCAYGNTPMILTCYNGYIDMVQWILHNDVNVDQRRDSGANGLFMASLKGNTDIVKLLLEKNPNVDLYDKNGCSSLLMASWNGHTDIVRLLLEKNPNVDLCNKDGWSPLYMASWEGHTDIVKLLLGKNPNIDLCTTDGYSPLYMASWEGHTHIVELLLEKNPNIDLCNKDGYSPLYMASWEGHTHIVELLLEKNPNIDLCNKDGWSPLYMASWEGHTDIVKLLLEKSPNVDLCDNDGWSPLYMASWEGHTHIVELLLEKSPNVDLCDNDGYSPLYMASWEGHTHIVELLLEKNPNIDLCNKDGYSPLYMASWEGHTDIVKLLLEKSPNVDLCTKDGNSPLYKASQKGHTDIVKLLLEKSPNVDLCNNYGFTALITACISNHTSVVQLLMKHKPYINAQTYDGGNALYFAAWNGNLEITKLLLMDSADCNLCTYSKQIVTDIVNNSPLTTLDEYKKSLFDSLVKKTSSYIADYVSKKSVEYAFDMEAGCSPLHIACFLGRIDVVGCLLDHNANINISKEDGTTPLFYACEVGHEDIVRLLLDKGADTNICRLDGKSPLQIATENGHTSTVMIVIEHMKIQQEMKSF